MNLLAGMYLYEIVLMVLGVVLFIVLVVAFLYQLMHQKDVKVLLGFFILPIVMIGYPSVQSVQYQNGVLTLQKATDELQSKPTDTALRTSLQNQVAQIGGRPSSDAKDLAIVAKAQYALGDEQAAKRNLAKALSIDPKLPVALLLQHKITVIDNLGRLASGPITTTGPEHAELQKNLAEASKLHIASPTALFKVAEAQAALGQHEAALKTANTAVTIDPSLAAKLKPLPREAIGPYIAPAPSTAAAP